MPEEEVFLSSSFSSTQFDPVNNVLYFEGTALEEGLWHGKGGKPRFFPKDVIQRHANEFLNLPVYCNHKYPIGTILDTFLTATGFGIKGVIRHQPTINAVLRGDLTGLSIGATILYDAIRNIAMQFLECKEVSIVEIPACTICRIDSNSCEQDSVTMSNEEKVDEKSAVDSFLQSAKDFAAKTKQLENVVTPKEDFEMPSENKNETEVETVTMSAYNEVAEKLESTTSELETARTELSAKEDELTKLKAELEEVQSELAGIHEAKREGLIERITTADPDANSEALQEMSETQLSAYADTVERLADSEPKIGADKQVEEKDSAELSAEPEPEMDTREMIIEYMRAQHNK